MPVKKLRRIVRAIFGSFWKLYLQRSQQISYGDRDSPYLAPYTGGAFYSE